MLRVQIINCHTICMANYHFCWVSNYGNCHFSRLIISKPYSYNRFEISA